MDPLLNQLPPQAGAYTRGVKGFKHPFFGSLACQRSRSYRDTPTLCQGYWPTFYEEKRKKKVSTPPPHPTPLSDIFRAGAASRPASNCKTPPLRKSCVRHYPQGVTLWHYHEQVSFFSPPNHIKVSKHNFDSAHSCMGGGTLGADNEVADSGGGGGHPLFVNNGEPLQLYCPSRDSAAHDSAKFRERNAWKLPSFGHRGNSYQCRPQDMGAHLSFAPWIPFPKESFL